MRFGFQRKEVSVVIPEMDGFLCLGLDTTRDYRKMPVRLFNEALLRGYSLMRATQGKYTRVWLPLDYFPLTQYEEYKVNIEHAQDDAHARVFCQDRSLFVSPVSPHLMGLCPHTHGGKFLSMGLIYDFIAGE